jgi:hypothetical protein
LGGVANALKNFKTQNSKKMKTKLMLLSLMLISTLSFSQNTIRVKTGEKIQNIIDDINTPAGSILLLDPGSYEGFTVYKRVSVIGSGFFNGSNTSTITGTVSFSENNNTNSDNSIITGCNVDKITIGRNNISILKCRLYNSFSGLSIGKSNNCIVKQCYIDARLYIESTTVTNFTIANNIILESIIFSFLVPGQTGRIVNNSIGFSLSSCTPISYRDIIASITVSNNIFLSPVTCDNRNADNNFQTSNLGKFNNNIVRKGNYQSTDISNKFITDMTTLFTNTGTSPDSKYILSANSPAKGAGEGGTDCGAFGGTEPYIIGGLPIGPVITDLQVPSTARQNETIQIKLKAKVQN